MKLRALLVVLLLTAAVQAQQPGQPTAVRSPEVSADRRVTFRVRAPNASKVTVFCECLSTEPALAKDAEGVWSITVGPIDPDIYEYHFTVDGVDTLDQRNPVVKYNSRPNLIESIVEVPGSAPLFYDVKNVPHGSVHIKYYPSKSSGTTRRAYIYTPPGYERSTARLPVLYLLHGAEDNVIPSVETVLLTNYLRDKTDVHAVLSGLITHAEVNRTPGAIEVWRLASFWRGIMRQ